MSKYENLDIAIMIKMGAQPQMFGALNVHDVREEVRRSSAGQFK